MKQYVAYCSLWKLTAASQWAKPLFTEKKKPNATTQRDVRDSGQTGIEGRVLSLVQRQQKIWECAQQQRKEERTRSTRDGKRWKRGEALLMLRICCWKAALGGSAGPRQKQTDKQTAQAVEVLVAWLQDGMQCSVCAQPHWLRFMSQWAWWTGGDRDRANLLFIAHKYRAEDTLKPRKHTHTHTHKKMLTTITDPWNKCRQNEQLLHIQWMSTLFAHACVHKHTSLTHTNQYAEPEPLRSLITASFTACSWLQRFFVFFSLWSAQKNGFMGTRIVSNVTAKLP